MQHLPLRAKSKGSMTMRIRVTSTGKARSSTCVWIAIVAFALFCGAETAMPEDLAQQTRKSEARQQKIQTDSDKLSRLWNTMLAEFERNGLSGSEADAMKKLRGEVSRLSADEMRAVIELLQQSRGATNTSTARERIAGAAEHQKQIVTGLKRLLGEFDRARVARETVKNLNELSRRASANLVKTLDLQKADQNSLLAPVLKASLEERQKEQTAIEEAFKAILPEIENLSSAAKTGEPWKEVLPKAREAAPLLSTATEALNTKELPQAVEAQRAARDAIRRLARLVTPENAVKVLREAEQDLNQLADDQKTLIHDTEQVPKESNYDEWLKKAAQEPNGPLSRLNSKARGKQGGRAKDDPGIKNLFDSVQRKRAADAAALEKREHALAETGREIRASLENSAKATADTLKQADAPLAAAQGHLNSPTTSGTPNVPAALLQENAALGQIQAAQTALQKELAQAEQAASSSAQPQSARQNEAGNVQPSTATLDDLQQQVRDLMGNEEQAARDARKQADERKKTGEESDPNETNRRTEQNVAAARAQQAMKQRTDQLQQRTANVSPPAAEALGKASDEMQKAQATLADPLERGKAATEAANHLKKASNELAREQAKQHKEESIVANAGKVAESLAAIIQAEQKLELDTVAAMGSNPPADAAQDIATKQDAIAKEAGTLKKSNTVTPEASNPLFAAVREMTTARDRALRSNLAGADESQRRALEQLYKARDVQATRIAAAEQQLGQTPQAQQPDSAAAQYSLDRAQAEVKQASETMAQAQAAKESQEGQQAQPDQEGQKAQKGHKGKKGRQAQQEQQGAFSPAMQAATQKLNSAALDVAQSQAAAQSEREPLQEAYRKAIENVTDAAAEAAQNGDPATAQQSAQKALDAIVQASALLAQQQAGITPSEPAAGEPSPGEAGEPSQSSQSKDQKSSSKQSDKPSSDKPQKATPPNGGGGSPTDSHNDPAPERGSRDARKSKAQFIGLPARDRAAIEQSESEKYPEEYGSMVEQYMRNLSDSARNQK